MTPFWIGSAVRKKIFYPALGALLFALCPSAQAQQPSKVPVIGRLGASSASAEAARREAFRQGLRGLGYLEGKNVLIEWRHAEGKADRLSALADELMRLKVNVIVTGGGNATAAVKRATSTIPIVMAQSGDPVADGFAASLARPGANITGLSSLSPELSGKRLELLKEVIPKLSRVAVFGTSSSPGDAPVLNETKLAADALGVNIQYVDVLSSKDFDFAFRSAAKGRAEAVLWLVSGAVRGNRYPQIAELAVKSRLPAIYSSRQYVLDGGLMSYGVHTPDLNRRAATYVDKILKGAKPADLPVEQPRKFELVINLKTAKQIGLTIPPNVLARADKVIK
jgi:putative ABC transport system substrate-binding protein